MSHTLNSPSNFSRRRACHGSSILERQFPDTSSIYTDEGSAAHALGEYCLLSNDDPVNQLGVKFGEHKDKEGNVTEFIVDGEMVDAVDIYVNHCRPLMNETTSVEQKFSIPILGEGEKGMADFVSVSDGILHVVDYKHGAGVPVEVEENIQGICYALGAAKEYDHLSWDKVRITIVQPRAFHKDGPVRSWEMEREDILDWKLDFAVAAVGTSNPNAPLAAGAHCRFCKALIRCKGVVQFIMECTGMDFNIDSSKPTEMQQLTDEQIVDLVFNKIPQIKRWCAALEDYAQNRAEEKDPLPGTKLVETRERRMWRDVKEAEEMLGKIQGAYERKFLTAPQMEKLLGKKKFAEYENLIIKKSTGVTLVPADDPRPSARPSGESEFTEVNLFD